MKISQELYKELRRLTRAAQRRMERATPGQRRALEFYVEKATGAKKWSSAAAGMTTQQAKAQIAKLEKFLAGESTTKRGWEALKKRNVEAANKTFARRRPGHNITDEELAEILMQLGDPTKEEFYKAVNKVQAMKGYKGDKWTGSNKDIANAIAQKWSSQAAYRRALDIRQLNVSNEKAKLQE